MYLRRRKYRDRHGVQKECRNWTIGFVDPFEVELEVSGFADKKRNHRARMP